jgi:hypothetical protein
MLTRRDGQPASTATVNYAARQQTPTMPTSPSGLVGLDRDPVAQEVTTLLHPVRDLEAQGVMDEPDIEGHARQASVVQGAPIQNQDLLQPDRITTVTGDLLRCSLAEQGQGGSYQHAAPLFGPHANAGKHFHTLVGPSAGSEPMPSFVDAAHATPPTGRQDTAQQQEENEPLTPAALLQRALLPIEPAILPRSRSLRRTRRGNRSPATATRRSHRVQNRKLTYTGSGNQTMKQARRLLMSKRGLALAEKGEESEDEAMAKYSAAFNHPLSPVQIDALSALAKGARGKGKKAQRAK